MAGGGYGSRARTPSARMGPEMPMRIVVLCLLVLSPALAAGQGQQGQAPVRWLKGNTHTHTLNSDGDSSPDEVVRWYREHGYQFLDRKSVV